MTAIIDTKGLAGALRTPGVQMAGGAGLGSELRLRSVTGVRRSCRLSVERVVERVR